ncbi:MAG TPA: element excision factor XisH family protein [Candidatus Xenobia bacterium]|jgi:hypothetical protein
MLERLQAAVSSGPTPQLPARQQAPARALYLAIPEDTYASLFDEAWGRDLATAAKLKMIVFDPKKEHIDRWIE